MSDTEAAGAVIHTPDQRVRVFVSSTLQELAPERQAVEAAVTRIRLMPVMFEQGARPHPPNELYRSYLAQSQIFVGVYWQSYGWLAPGEELSGLEDEYQLSEGMPRLIYVKSPAPERDPRLTLLLDRIRADAGASYRYFTDAEELGVLLENDLALLLSERFEQHPPVRGMPPSAALPASATSLLDREEDIAAVSGMVVGQQVRLVTLTGPGGVGKSRLAVASATGLAPQFSDGAAFIDLSTTQTADVVVAIATRLGVHSASGSARGDLVSYLRDRQMLLVLDNVEQLTEAAPLLAQLLAAAPGLTVIVTSRRVLRLRGEHEYPVEPLSVPPPEARGPDELGGYAAVALFVQRAQESIPGFALTDANCLAVAQICRQLDGLPLAVELAASRVGLLPPAAILGRLQAGGMSALPGTPRDLPERQQTLRTTLDWSFDLLTPDQQDLFIRLAVFAGSFTLADAQAVCGPVPAPGGAGTAASVGRLIDSIGVLVDSSLVRLLTDDEPRFTLLATVRAYARARLRDSDMWDEAHQRHALQFSRWATPRDSELRGSGQVDWLHRLEASHDDLAAAMAWLVDHEQVDRAVRLLWNTWRYWWLLGHTGDVSRHVDTFLGSAGKLSPHDQALALAGSGFTLWVDGDEAAAQALFERSLPLYGLSEDQVGAALVAAGLGHLLARQHRDDDATALLQETICRLSMLGRDGLSASARQHRLLALALADNFLGLVRLRGNDRDGAAAALSDGLTAARTADDRFTIVLSLFGLARSRRAQGDLAGAAALLTEGMSLADEAGDRSTLAYYLEAMAEIAGGDHPTTAVTLLSAATALLRASGCGWLLTYVPRSAHDEQALGPLRQRIGDADFEQAWDQGQAAHRAEAMRQAVAVATRLT